jgi:hypothetical protein
MRAISVRLAAVALGAFACAEGGFIEPPPGATLRISALVSGIDIQEEYRVEVGGQTALIRSNGVASFALPPGAYEVAVALAPNCGLEGANPARVDIPSYAVAPREITELSLQVTCRAVFATIEVLAQASGRDFPAQGFTVQLAGPSFPLSGQALANTSLTFDVYEGGMFTIALTSLPDHCVLTDDEPRVVSVTVGGTTRDVGHVAFPVTCHAITGDIRVTSRTSGAISSFYGYRVELDGMPVIVPVPSFYYYYYYDVPLFLRLNDTYLIERVVPGNHELFLRDIPASCSVSGQNPRPLSVGLGETTAADFEIVCS